MRYERQETNPDLNREVDLVELRGWSLSGFTECLIQDVAPNPMSERTHAVDG